MRVRFSKPFFATLLLTLFCSTPMFAQEQEQDENFSARQLEKKGDRLMKREDWEAAKVVYHKLLKADPDNDNFNFDLGIAYFNSGVQKEKSITYFERVNEVEIPVVGFYLARSYHYNGDYENAIETFQNFRSIISTSTDNGRQLAKDVERYIAQCKSLANHTANKDELLSINNLGTEVNTKYTEYAPVIYEENSVMIFTATNKNTLVDESVEVQTVANEDLFISNYDEESDTWGNRHLPDGTFIKPELNTKKNESSINFNVDKNKFYYFRVQDMFVSEEKKAPENTHSNTNKTPQDQLIAIYINKQENIKFMVTELLTTDSGRDIYFSTLEDDKWTNWRPHPLNTIYDEDSPYLTEDGKTLYFTSNGYNSIGGHDIFKSTWDGQKWSEPENLGMPINSPGNDIHFVPTSFNPLKGYIASDRKGTNGNMDIYRFKRCGDYDSTLLEGIFLAEGKPVQGTLLAKNIAGNVLNRLDIIDGTYAYKVANKTTYKIEFTAKGNPEDYFPHQFQFTTPKQCEEFNLYQKLTVQIRNDKTGRPKDQLGEMHNAFYDIDRHRKGKSREEFIAEQKSGSEFEVVPDTQIIPFPPEVILATIKRNVKFEHVYFDFDKSNFKSQYQHVTDSVVNFMKANPKVNVLIQGHTDTKGSLAYNIALSQRRIKSVLNNLVKKGIDKKRISTEYFGETRPLAPDHENGKYVPSVAARNRRVEIHVDIEKAEQEYNK